MQNFQQQLAVHKTSSSSSPTVECPKLGVASLWVQQFAPSPPATKHLGRENKHVNNSFTGGQEVMLGHYCGSSSPCLSSVHEDAHRRNLFVQSSAYRDTLTHIPLAGAMWLNIPRVLVLITRKPLQYIVESTSNSFSRRKNIFIIAITFSRCQIKLLCGKCNFFVLSLNRSGFAIHDIVSRRKRSDQ